MAATALDTDLVTNVKKALKREPAQPMFFAFVMKGGTDGKLIVSKAKIQPKQIDGAKKETGGSAVLKGVCFGDNGTLVFEMARPAAPNVAAVTKNVLKAKAGLACKVEYRVGRDDETIAESAEPDLPSDAAGAAVPAAEGAAAAAAAKPPTVASDAEWKAKLAAWTPAIKAALVAKGPNAGDIGKLLAQATALSKPGGDMAQALAKLTECHALATAGPGPAASGGESQAAAPDTPQNARANWEQALAKTEPDYLQGLRARPDDASKLRAVMGFAQAKAEKGDFPGALAALQKLADMLAKASAPVQPTPADGLAAALKSWEAARNGAVKSVLQLDSAMSKTTHPEATKASILLKSIAKQLMGTRPDNSATIADLERYLTTDDVIAAAEEPNRFGIAVKIKAPLMKELTALKPLVRA